MLKRIGLLAVVAAVALSSCGGGDEEPVSTATVPMTTVPPEGSSDLVARADTLLAEWGCEKSNPTRLSNAGGFEYANGGCTIPGEAIPESTSLLLFKDTAERERFTSRPEFSAAYTTNCVSKAEWVLVDLNESYGQQWVDKTKGACTISQ